MALLGIRTAIHARSQPHLWSRFDPCAQNVGKLGRHFLFILHVSASLLFSTPHFPLPELPHTSASPGWRERQHVRLGPAV